MMMTTTRTTSQSQLAVLLLCVSFQILVIHGFTLHHPVDVVASSHRRRVINSNNNIKINTRHFVASTKDDAATEAKASDDDDDNDEDTFASIALTTAGAITTLAGETIVVKYGGNAMTSTELKQKFCQDVAALQALGVRVVVVHGGGPQINAMLQKVGVESRFEGGLRVSSRDVVDVAEMVLCGSVNKEIASTICSHGGRAIGISGRDDSLLQCSKEINADGHDLGFVGKVEHVNVDLLDELLDLGLCPVVSPIGTGMASNKEVDVSYNVNADVAAGRIAGELQAARVLFLTDIAGVLDKDMQLISNLSCDQVQALIDNGTISGGMIPKCRYATSAVQLGVKGAMITDGRVPHALLKEVLGGGAESMGSGSGGTVVTL